MTTLGHSLTGLAALTLAMPTCLSWGLRIAWAILYIALANLPDWPLPGWGHHDLDLSHSLWLNLALCALAALALRRWLPGRLGQAPILWAGAAAWLSHIGMDLLYGDLPGMAIFWPFSHGLASLPLPWLKTLPHVPPPFDASVIKILVLEFVTFAPAVFIAGRIRRRLHKKSGN